MEKGYPKKVLKKRFDERGGAAYFVEWDNNETSWVWLWLHCLTRAYTYMHSHMHSQEPTRRLGNYYDLMEAFEHPADDFEVPAPIYSSRSAAATRKSSSRNQNKRQVSQSTASASPVSSETEEADGKGPRLSPVKSSLESRRGTTYHRTAGTHSYAIRNINAKSKIKVKTPPLHWNQCLKCGGVCFLPFNSIYCFPREFNCFSRQTAR